VRKAVLIISALALGIAPLTAANATTKYKVTIAVGPQDIDVSRSHGDNVVTIHGTVSGGPVKGKTVKIYRVNQSGQDHTKVHVHNVTLPSTGKYSTTDHPPLGGHYIYSAEKAASTGTVVATHHLDAYQFDFASVFYQNGAYNLPQPSGDFVKVQQTGQLFQTTPNGSDKGHYSGAYSIKGGGTLGFHSIGNRCKGVTFHIGVSNDIPLDNDIPYRYTVYKGTTAVFTHTMHQGDPVYQVNSTDRKKFGEQVADGDFRIKVDAAAGDDNPLFVVGLPKIACTYPDPTNID
jgi:hypothetical protein